jgi:hypothetical protein
VKDQNENVVCSINKYNCPEKMKEGVGYIESRKTCWLHLNKMKREDGGFETFAHSCISMRLKQNNRYQ